MSSATRTSARWTSGRARTSGSIASSGSACTPSTADVTAWVYVLDAYEGGLPSARYLGIMADAAEVAGAPADYVADLRSRPCRSIG